MSSTLKPTIGIYGASTQSGMTYLGDLMSRGYRVVGYCRESEHGKSIVNSIRETGGIWLHRPENQNEELTRFVPLEKNILTHDLRDLVKHCDVIILSLPSHFHEEAVRNLQEAGLSATSIPLILSPARTFAVPYLWKILGEDHPIVSLSTSPYSCKTISPNAAFLKRRKRTWLMSFEGTFEQHQRELICNIFPQGALAYCPGITALSNIGAVFHPGGYLLNYEEITFRAATDQVFSFYVEGIGNRPEVAQKIEAIDQTRLQIAEAVGLETFGLKENPREDTWRKLINGLRALEQEHEGEIDVLREIRAKFLHYLNRCVFSAAHWLDITYGVERIPGEPFHETIMRTPTYRNQSYPQLRYIEEDIPTGLVPLEALARVFNLPHPEISEVIEKYNNLIGHDIRRDGRNIEAFSPEYIRTYLTSSNRT